MRNNVVPPQDVKPEITEEMFRTPSMCSTGGVFNCVAVAITSGRVAVRNSQDPNKTTLDFTPSEWRNFIDAVRNGEFDPI